MKMQLFFVPDTPLSFSFIYVQLTAMVELVFQGVCLFFVNSVEGRTHLERSHISTSDISQHYVGREYCTYISILRQNCAWQNATYIQKLSEQKILFWPIFYFLLVVKWCCKMRVTARDFILFLSCLFESRASTKFLFVNGLRAVCFSKILLRELLYTALACGVSPDRNARKYAC